jgi:hypothetical protein
MADKSNPAEKTAAETDYEEKFNRSDDPGTATNELKAKESDLDVGWKTSAKGKSKTASNAKRGGFNFARRRAGKLRQGSAFAFIFVMIGLGIWYTSFFAPNILLVNIKEMYTNDLSDATIALDTYYKKLLNYKIGRPQCSGSQTDIKCKLSTMSRAEVKSFEKHGFVVVGNKVQEDNRDDGVPGNDQPESRYQVVTIIPPSQSPGVIATGDMLFLYGQMSSANKALIYSVFNPKSSFFMDTRFKQRIKNKYGLNKSISVGGSTEQQVDRSFDSSIRNSGGGIDMYGRPDSVNGVSLGSLSNPVTAAQLELAIAPLAAQANSFVGLQCAYYSFGKAVTNDAKTAKAATVARFAMQYLKAADQIKAGTSDDVTINALSSKLASGVGGGFNGSSATESSMYKSIVYNEPPIPSIFGILYGLDTFDLIGAMIPAWSQIMASAAAEGTASNVPGQLTMPPANLGGGDRDYCLGGETTQNHAEIKNNMTEQCIPEVTASAPPGLEGALAPAELVARETCNPPHDHRIHEGSFENEKHGIYALQPSVKATAAIISPYVAGIFSANVIAWANATSLLFTSQAKGMAASDAIFAGTGEVLGDMAQSRGMMPSNVAFMEEYLAQKPAIEKDFDDVARYNARKNPFDPYNEFSFLGSIVHGLTPVYSDKAPLLATLSNGVSLLGDSIKHLNPSANAIYYHQPDPFNPLRLHCPDPEYYAIMIMADSMCNVRYSMSRLELAAQPDQILDYMTQSHSDAYKDKIQELTERAAQADPEDGDAANVGRMVTEATSVSQQPFIDKTTGKATPGSEYDKFLEYCVNRQDPWGRSAIHVHRSDLPDALRQYRVGDKSSQTLESVSPSDRGDPYQKVPIIGYSSISEGAKAEQDWYTGKKCLDQSEMMTNFRAYTMLCSVDGSLSGGVDCTDTDSNSLAGYSNDFFTSNDILYQGG